MEYRIKDVSLQAEDDGLMKVGGYINVTERESEMLYSKRKRKWFKEVMKRGVFQRAIEKAREIPLLFEHNWEKRLATTKDKSLTLKEDNVGLKFEAIIEDRSVYDQVKSGAINSCSFGFRALEEEIEPIDSRLERRFVSDIELLEVSLVSNPAYVGSLAEVRAYEEETAEETKEKEEVVEAESEVEEVRTEEVVDDTEDNSEKTEESEETEEAEEEADTREIGVNNVTPQEIPREVLIEIVEDLINQKMADLREAEVTEQIANEQLQDAKEFHEEVERDLANNCMKYNSEVIKMRLQLLKLNTLKEGI